MELIQPPYPSSEEALDKKIASAPLFACTKCMKKFPFSSLSEDKQCCPDCRAASINVKCLYCQAEFEGTGNSSLCKHCYKNEKHFGKPKACEWCSMLSAFNKSNICARCKHYNQKFGAPVCCERCKRECAFDRKEHDKSKSSGKVFCWSCMQTFRRKKCGKEDINGNRKRPMEVDSLTSNGSSIINHSSSAAAQSKAAKTTELVTSNTTDQQSLKSQETTPEYTFSLSKSSSANAPAPLSSREVPPPDSFMLITELRDKISSLEKQLSAKEIDISSKDKQIAELKTEMSVNEQTMRNKVQTLQRLNTDYVEQMAIKSREMSQLQKQLNAASRKEKKQ